MGLPMHLHLTKEDFKYFKERSLRQQKCKHEFPPSSEEKNTDVKKIRKVTVCLKCGYRQIKTLS